MHQPDENKNQQYGGDDIRVDHPLFIEDQHSDHTHGQVKEMDVGIDPEKNGSYKKVDVSRNGKGEKSDLVIGILMQ